ncbi:MAG: PEP-CTERM sorting domain-containing protein [Pirellulaceae bacterium]
MTRLFIKSIFYVVVFLVSSAASVWADISYTSNGQVVTQDFNSLGTAGASWTDDSTIAGWFSNRTTYLAGNGSGTAGGLYSYGATGNSERAIGSLASNSVDPVQIGIRLTNLSGKTLTKLTVTYDGEQWRAANNGSAHSLTFAYAIGSSLTLASPGTAVSQLNFTSPILTNAGALDGNAAANRVAGITFAINNITWLPGQQLVLRWTDVNDSGNDHGLAVDNFNFIAVPEPTTFGLGSLLGLAVLAMQRRRK